MMHVRFLRPIMENEFGAKYTYRKDDVETPRKCKKTLVKDSACPEVPTI